VTYRPRVIPTLLLKERGLVKTVKFDAPSYVGDPINAVKIFNDAEADELIFLDIEATRLGRLPPFELVRQIADEAFMPFAIGGGIRTLDHVRQLLDLGAEKVAINSAADDAALIGDASATFGAQAVVVSIDARLDADGVHRVYTRGGTQPTGVTAEDAARRAETSGAGELLVASIDRDGTGAGFDLELIARVAAAVSIPVIACGGAGSYEDLRTPIADAGASAVAAGSLFVYVGRKRGVLINYPDQAELVELFA
jgi:imidazole glycerol-phosphate synthase subunit HisF